MKSMGIKGAWLYHKKDIVAGDQVRPMLIVLAILVAAAPSDTLIPLNTITPSNTIPAVSITQSTVTAPSSSIKKLDTKVQIGVLVITHLKS